MPNSYTNEQIAILRQAQMAANSLMPGHPVPEGNKDCPACRLSEAIEEFIRTVREK